MVRENVFALNPVDYELERQKAERQGRSIFGQTEQPKQPKQPALKPDGAPDFGRIATETQVPRNLIIALTDAAGIKDGAQKGAFAAEAASRIGKEMAGGKDARAALKSILGEDAPVDDLIEAAKAVPEYDRIGAEGEKPQSEADGSTVGDLGKQFVGGVVKGTGAAIEGAGMALDRGNYGSELVDEDGDGVPEPKLTEKDEPSPMVLNSRKVADMLREYGEGVQGGVSERSKEAIKGSTPDGDIFKPATWSLGENPSLRGYTMLTMDVLGSLAPVVVSSVLTRSPAGGMAMGGAQSGGAGADEARKIVLNAAREQVEGPDGKPISRLEAESPYYRDLRQQGESHEVAAQKTAEAAGELAFSYTAPIGAFGGAATGAIVTGGVKGLAGRSIGTRVGGSAALGSIEEGVQETAEGVATRKGAADASGLDIDLTEGTFGDAILGALAGGPIGAAGGLATEGRQQDEEPDADTPPATDPAQITGPGEGGGPAAGPDGPVGPPAAPQPDPSSELAEISEFARQTQGAALTDSALPRMQALEIKARQAGATDQQIEDAFNNQAPPAPEPTGPVGRAAQNALALDPEPQPTGMFPDLKPGGNIALRDADGRDYNAVFLREDETGVTVRIAGEEITLTPQEFDDSRDAAMRKDDPAEAAERPAESGPFADDPMVSDTDEVPQETTPAAEVELPEGIDRDDFEERAAIIQESEDIPRAEAEARALDMLTQRMEEQRAAEQQDAIPDAEEMAEQGQVEAPVETAENAEDAAPITTEPPASVEGVEGGVDTPSAAPELQAEWWKSMPRMRKAAKDLGLTKEGVGEAWGDGDALRQVVETELRRQSGADSEAVTGDLASEPEVSSDDSQPAAQIERNREIVNERLRSVPRPPDDRSKHRSWFVKLTPEQRRIAIRKGLEDVGGKTSERWWESSDGGDRQEVIDAVRDAHLEKDSEATAPDAPPAAGSQIERLRQVAEITDSEGMKETGAHDEVMQALKDLEEGTSIDAVVPQLQSASERLFRDYPDTADALDEIATALESDAAGVVEQEQGESEPQEAERLAEAVDDAAQETAVDPTPAQAEAENYKTGKVEWQGFTLSIENRKGTMRRKAGTDGETVWEVEMPAHYGRILGTKGADGDHVDFYMGDNPESESVWVVDQMDAETGRFDEHKVMLGFTEAAEASETYKAGFSDGKGGDRLGGMRKMSVAEFKGWLDGDTTKPVTPKAKRQDAEARTEGDAGAAEREMTTDDGYRVKWSDKGTEIYEPTRGLGVRATSKQLTDAEVNEYLDELRKPKNAAGIAAKSDTSEDEAKSEALKVIYRVVIPEFEDGEGSYTSRFGDVQIDDLGNGDAEFTVTLSRSRFKGGAKETRERSKKLKFSEARDSLSDEAKEAVEKVMAPAPKPEAGQSKTEVDQFARARAYLPEPGGEKDLRGGLVVRRSKDGKVTALYKGFAFHEGMDPMSANASATTAKRFADALENVRQGDPEIDAKIAKSVMRELRYQVANTTLPEGFEIEQNDQRVKLRGPDGKVKRDTLLVTEDGTEGISDEMALMKRMAEAGARIEETAPTPAAPEPDTASASSILDQAFDDVFGGNVGAPIRSADSKVVEGIDFGASDVSDRAVSLANRIADVMRNAARVQVYEGDVGKALSMTSAVVDARNMLESELGPDLFADVDNQIENLYEAERKRLVAEKNAPQGAEAPAPQAVNQDAETAWDSAGESDRTSVFTAGGWTLKNSNSLNEAAKRNLDRDWKDLTPAAQKKVREAIDNGMLLGEYANEERQRRASPAPRTAGEAASSATTNAAGGAADIVSGLNALFGDPNKLSSGLTFDAETYAKAKPLFISAVRKFGAAGQDIMDVARAMVRGLMAEGLQREAQQNMRPYLERFIEDVQSGAIDPFADDAISDTLPSDQQSEAPENVGSTEAGDQASVAPAGAGGRDGASVETESGADTDSGSRGAGDRTDEGADANDQPNTGVVGSGTAVSETPVGERSGVNPGNFVITPDFPLGEGTDGAKIKANMEALRLVKALEAENRFATPEEQAVLARYVGWGGLKKAFDSREAGKTNQWGRAQAELKELLTREEYAAIVRSTENAHFTSRRVVNAMWRAMERFGFEGGRALEPTVGTGNFVGLMPEGMAAKTDWYAAELDNVTGAIAKHLYPDATVMAGQGFQDVHFRSGSMDVAIGNPPFGADKLSSKLHPDIPAMSVHNYIIAKTGLMLREGGIMGMVVTNRFLDVPNDAARSYLARNFDFLGAVRLPNTAFQANAGTEVTTDVVWFQKRREGEPRGDLSWLEAKASLPGTNVTLNKYFADNPDMMLGRPGMDGTMRGAGEEFTLHDDGRDLDVAMDQAMAKMDARLPDRTEALQDAVVQQEVASDMDVGDFHLDDNGKVIMRGVDTLDGEANIGEVTEKTPWGAGAAEMEWIIQRLDAVEDAAENGTMDARAAALSALAGELQEVNLFTEDKKAKKTTPTGFGKALDPALAALDEAINADTPMFGRDQKAAVKTFREELSKKAIGKKKLGALTGMLDLRRRFQEQLRAERENAADIETRRTALRKAYKTFVREHGYVNSPANTALVSDRPGVEFGLEQSYTAADKKKGVEESAREASILRKRLVSPYEAPDTAANATDGLHVSLRERGRLDLPYIANLTGQDVAAVKAELTEGEKPNAFYDPKLQEFVIADEYLSGNLKEKIEAAEKDGLQENVRALEAAMPEPKTKEQISPSIRSQWMPVDIFKDFMSAMGVTYQGVNISPTIGKIVVEGAQDGNLTAFGEQFKTRRKSVAAIFEAAITGKDIVVTDPTGDGNKRVKNVADTEEANLAVQRMADEFEKWAYLNPERAQSIVDAFNSKVNVITERKFDGVSYLRMVGANPDISLRDTQKNGAWRMIQQDRTLMHHVVGSGKTMTAIAAVMERKRLGLSRKSMIVVPNHLVGQWGKEFRELYPGANLLVADKDDFSKARRRKMFARIASGEYDAVIIGHSQMRMIENDPKDTKMIVEEQVDALQKSLEDAKASGESKRTAGEIQKQLDKLTKKLETLDDALKADDLGITFSDMGIDNIVVDEAHEFKNLEYATAGARMVGMNNPVGSQRAFDLYTKLRGLQGRKGATHFLTGTPVSNSLVEIYTMMKYLGHDMLKSMNLDHFDAWSSAFIKDEKRFEYTPAMTLKERRVIRGVVNAETLSRIYKSFADILMRPDVERVYAQQMEKHNKATGQDLPTRFPTPKVKGGGRELVLVESGPVQKEFTQYLVMRAEGIARNSPKTYSPIDNMLWVLSDARKASIDLRTIDPEQPRLDNSKVVKAGDKILDLHRRYKDVNGTQLVFADSSVPMTKAKKDLTPALTAGWKVAGLSDAKAKERVAADKEKTALAQYEAITDEIDRKLAEGEFNSQQQDRAEEWMDSDASDDLRAMAMTNDYGFSFYDDLKAYLTENGVPESEVAFVHSYDTPQKKGEMQAAMNSGELRVLIGSTFKMGAGMNAQERMVAIHHIDAPWRPSDMEQREGRGIRQGNKLYEADPEGFEFEIYAYTMEQSSDTVLWQVLERKATGIESFMNSTADAIMEEGDGDADSFAAFMAQSTGNPVFIDKMQAEKDLTAEKSRIANAAMIKSEAESWLAGYESKKERAEESARKSRRAAKLPEYGADAGQTYRDYDDAMLRFDAAKEAHEAEADKIRAENENLPKGTKKKPLPKFEIERPEIYPDGGNYDPYATKVFEALVNVAKAPKNDRGAQVVDVPIDSGDTVLRIERRAPGDKIVHDADVVRKSDGMMMNLAHTSAKDIFGSRGFMKGIRPEHLTMKLNAAAESADARAAKLENIKPEMEQKASANVSYKRLHELEESVTVLKGLTRLAEVEAAKDRIGKSNRFADLDDKGRDLSRESSADKPLYAGPNKEPFSFEVNGDTFTAEFGARDGTIVEQGDARFDRIWMDATNTDGDRRLVMFKGKQYDKPEDAPDGAIQIPDTKLHLTVEESYPVDRDDPVKAMRARRGTMEPSVTATPATARKLRADLQAELVNAGIADRVKLRVAGGFTYQGETLDGYFFDGVIGVGTKAKTGPKGALRHEIIHALRNKTLWGSEYGLFTQGEWRALAKAARGNKDIRERIEANYGDLNTTGQTEEMVAEMFREWMGARDMDAPAAGALDKLRRIINALVNALRRNGANEAAQVMERIRSGEVGGRGPDGPGGGRPDPLKATRRPEIPLSSARDIPALKPREWRKNGKELWGDMLTDAMGGGKLGKYNILSLVPGRALFEELGRNLPAARAYLALKEKMDAMRQDWHSRTDTAAREWIDLGKKNTEANGRLMDLMHRSTLAGIDPSQDFTPSLYESEASNQRESSYNRLRAEFDALPREFQKVFRKIRDDYSAIADQFEIAIIENIQNAQKIAEKRAERDYEKEMQRITDEGLTGQKRKDAIDAAKSKLAGAKSRMGWAQKARIAELRAQFESNKLSGPYFPLARFGNYFVAARDEKGKVVSFSRHERQRDQRKEATRLEAEGYAVDTGVLSGKDTDLKQMVDPTFVADMENLLATWDVDPAVMDTLWQKWLETLPDQSIRTSQIHRKGQAGYQKDALRAYTHHMFHGSHQLARLKYGLQMEEAINDAYDQAARSEDTNRSTLVVDEMNRRHQWTMNPQVAGWSSGVTSLAFVWYLGATPAAAMVNLTQTTVVGVPIMKAAYDGVSIGQIGRAMSRASVDFVSGKGEATNSDRLSGDEKRAVKEAQKRGIIDKTQAHELAGVAETGIEYSGKREKVMRVFSYLFHKAEVANREVTFLANYRLAKTRGMQHDAAVDKAGSLTWKIHFDYQGSSRPRFMQGDVARVALIFRQFSVNMLYRLFRDTHQAFEGATKEERREAKAQVVGMTLSMMMHAGITGTWGYGLITMLLSIFFPGDDDDIDEWLHDTLLIEGSSMGAAAWNYTMGMALKGVPGHATGVALSERIGMPNLWFRGPFYDMEAADTVEHYTHELLGPAASIVFSMGRGIETVFEGDWWRGTESMVPKMLKDASKAVRYGTQGVETRNGDPIIEDVSVYQLLVQAMGFTPAQLAERYDDMSRMRDMEREIMQERSALHREAGDSVMAGKGITEAILKKIRAFNKAHPMYPIRRETIRRSLQGRQRYSEGVQGGVNINKKLRPEIESRMAPQLYD